jgi:succinate dehydrogenase / fumarate reductase flavoprotein subunit
MAMAYRAGVPLADMEFVQFHPLGIGAGNMVLPEVLVTSGGRLLNKSGEQFMEGETWEQARLADGDGIARAVAMEIAGGRGCDDGAVRLDLTRLPAKKIIERLGPRRSDITNFAGIDPIDTPIPVAPAQRFCIGGLATDENGATGVRALFAAGECACTGAHGARPLQGNTLLDAVVFGKRAGLHAAKAARKRARKGADEILTKCRQSAENHLKRLQSNGPGEPPTVLRERLADLMWTNAGVVRSESGLIEARQRLRQCQKEYDNVEVAGRSARFNGDLMTALDVGEMLDLADAILLSAASRAESRGVHFRSDYSQQDNTMWLKRAMVTNAESGPVISHDPVMASSHTAGKEGGQE